MKGLSLASAPGPKAESAPEAELTSSPGAASPPPMPKPAPGKGRRRTWRNVFERVLLPLIIGGAVYLVWWGLERLRRVQQQSAALTQQTARLSTEIELMDGQWTEARARAVGAQFGEATAAVFRGAPEVKAWGENLTREALRRALDVQLRFVGTRSSMPGEKAFTVMRARLDIRPAPGVESPLTPFQRLLDFTDTLVTQTQRVDLLELRVQGAGNSLRRAQAIVELWGIEATDAPSSDAPEGQSSSGVAESSVEASGEANPTTEAAEDAVGSDPNVSSAESPEQP